MVVKVINHLHPRKPAWQWINNQYINQDESPTKTDVIFQPSRGVCHVPDPGRTWELGQEAARGHGLPRSWRVHVLSAKVQVRCFVHGPVFGRLYLNSTVLTAIGNSVFFTNSVAVSEICHTLIRWHVWFSVHVLEGVPHRIGELVPREHCTKMINWCCLSTPVFLRSLPACHFINWTPLWLGIDPGLIFTFTVEIA